LVGFTTNFAVLVQAIRIAGFLLRGNHRALLWVFFKVGWVRMILRRAFLGLAVGWAFLLGDCTTGAYFWQATAGHLSDLAAAEKINEVLSRPDVPEKLRTQLQ